MRYCMQAVDRAEIWPGNLRGLTAALKKCMEVSAKVHGVVTLSIHEPGRKVPFRRFKDGAEIWAAPVGDDD